MHPKIIQGGMGVGVSGWELARAVSQLGQLGVVSGTALAVTLARRLQLGDHEGHLRRALGHFPFADMAKRVLADYFVPRGKGAQERFKLTPMPLLNPGRPFQELTVAANFVEVFLAKEGHRGLVGINYLEKIQLPTLPSIFGAMLAGVDYVLMGAGIPRGIPGALDMLARGARTLLRIDVHGAGPGEEFNSSFDPQEFCNGTPPPLKRPQFLGIVSSATLAMTLAKKASGRVDGFVVEGDTAGGHNAPPRGPLQLTPEGEPLYGPRDVADLEKIRALGLPFWLAGSYGQPGKLREALTVGAAGIQVGTAFAFCEESGIPAELKARIIALSRATEAHVFTSPVASPTGFPFKVVQLPGTIADPAEYAKRVRICDLGYLREVYRKEDGTVGYRCSAEPLDAYQAKGGSQADTIGRLCICNALPATIGLGQWREDGTSERPVLTAGNEVANVARFVKPGKSTYTAAEVVECLLKD